MLWATIEGVDVMRSDPSESVTGLVHRAVQVRREAEARQIASGLIRGNIGPDHKVTNMPDFYSALVQALKDARRQGQDDCDVLTLT
jgi:hypothetical protein